MDDVRIRSRELPFSDRHSQLNSSARYENLPRPRIEYVANAYGAIF